MTIGEVELRAHVAEREAAELDRLVEHRELHARAIVAEHAVERARKADEADRACPIIGRTRDPHDQVAVSGDRQAGGPLGGRQIVECVVVLLGARGEQDEGEAHAW